LAYRRMLDWCYLHEKQLPEDIGEVARLIRMRSHSESIANVLREFFELIDGGWWSERVGREIQAIQDKSEKAKASAQARWNATAMRPHSDGNAIQDPRPKTQDTKPIKTKAVVTAPPGGVSQEGQTGAGDYRGLGWYRKRGPKGCNDLRTGFGDVLHPWLAKFQSELGKRPGDRIGSQAERNGRIDPRPSNP